MSQMRDNSLVQDGSLIFKGQCSGRVLVDVVLKLLVTWCSKGPWEDTRSVTSSGNACLLTHMLKWDPSCTGWSTRPAPKQIMTNQLSAFVDVATTSWEPKGVGISANPGWDMSCSLSLTGFFQSMTKKWQNPLSIIITLKKFIFSSLGYFLRMWGWWVIAIFFAIRLPATKVRFLL